MTLIFLQCIIKGITENPFVIWITAIYPYVVLVIFFIRAIFLEGMADGILHLFQPKVKITRFQEGFHFIVLFHKLFLVVLESGA